MASILFDLDGTLAEYRHGVIGIGNPIPKMLQLVKNLIAADKDVWIFTARVADDKDGSQRADIDTWCEKYFGQKLPVTCEKNYSAGDIYDDHAVQVISNTGITVVELAKAYSEVLEQVVNMPSSIIRPEFEAIQKSAREVLSIYTGRL